MYVCRYREIERSIEIMIDIEIEMLMYALSELGRPDVRERALEVLKTQVRICNGIHIYMCVYRYRKIHGR